MRKTPIIPLLSIIVLVVAAMACGGGESTPEPVDPPAATEQPAESQPTEIPAESGGDYNTIFPLPDDVQNFTEMGENMINFQTSLSLEETVEFYRQAFGELDLTERDILTVIDDAAFSMAFDGWENGWVVVIQGVAMGETTNVNIRFEDI